MESEGWGTCRDWCERKAPEIDRMLPFLEVLVFLLRSREEVQLLGGGGLSSLRKRSYLECWALFVALALQSKNE